MLQELKTLILRTVLLLKVSGSLPVDVFDCGNYCYNITKYECLVKHLGGL